LRGCIGRFGEHQQLYKVVQDMAIAAATEDNRFEPVDVSELEQLILKFLFLHQ
jgi:AMMECR1 domain-containing protein